MLRKPVFTALILTLTALMAGGCLTVERKEYTFEFTGKNSGILTIRFINILSIMDDETDVSEADYEELINDYVNGTKIEDEFPMASLISKRLYRQNDMLCGEVVLEFTNLMAAKLYQYDKNSPLMYALCEGFNSESYVSSNGTFGGEYMPVVMWPNTLKKLLLFTSVTEPSETTISLVDYFDEY